MEVSKFVVTDRIEEFDVDDRFLKLPIERLLELKGIEPIAPQCAIINAVNDPQYRFIVACLSRRTGKTFVSNHIGFLKAMEPNTSILIVSPNYSLTGISWDIQVGILNEYGIEIVRKNKTEREIHLSNGSMIKFGSVARADSLVGRSYDLIIFDECALDGNGGDAFNVQLRPTLDRVGSKAIFISTPRGLNWYYEYYMRGFNKTPSGEDKEYKSWISIHSTWRDNPRNTIEDIEEARAAMSAAEFKQEYEADFATFEGQIYEAFSEDSHVYTNSILDFSDYRRFETIMGVDHGYKDYTYACVIKYDTLANKYYIVDEYQDNVKSTSQLAAGLRRLIDKWGVEMTFVDSAAAQFRADLAADYDIGSTSAKKSVLDGIGFVQSLLEQSRLFVHSDCVNAIKMFYNYRWDPNNALQKPRPVHDSVSHAADGIRYGLYSYRGQ